MGVLRVRVGDQWVDVTSAGGGGGAEEVYVGTDDPVVLSPTAELWYDTDAAATMPLDYRWNTAWGVVVSASTVPSQSLAATGTWYDVTALTATWTAVAGRRYKISAVVVIQKTTAAGNISLRLTDGGATTHIIGISVDMAVGYATVPINYIETAVSSGTITRKIQIQTNTLGCAINSTSGYGSTLVVEDIGPAAGFVPAADPGQPWTDFVPTLTAGVAVTKTVSYARYTKVGRMVTANVWLAITGVGTASNLVAVGLPLPPAGTTGPIGTFLYLDAGTAWYSGAAMMNGAVVNGQAHGLAAYIGQAPAFTTANTDAVGYSVTYESAT